MEAKKFIRWMLLILFVTALPILVIGAIMEVSSLLWVGIGLAIPGTLYGIVYVICLSILDMFFKSTPDYIITDGPKEEDEEKKIGF